MNVVLYMRYSSDRQTEQSIEGQRRVCLEFCKREGYNVVGSYIDRATSAFKDTDKRTNFQRMIRDSEKQQWDAVVVYKLDRFARNRYDSATYKAKLKKNGVRVISATENISDNPEGVILEAVLEGMAEFYSKELSQKISRGMRETARKGNSVGGHISLGYKIENKKLVIVESQAQIVREAFDLYAKGWTVADISRLFNEKGYRTAKGAQFNKNSFKSIFKNERYIGVYQFQDVRVEGGVPAIIDKDTFERVQIRLKTNAQAPARGKAKVDYLLSQKLFCGHCGALMRGESGTSATGRVYNYYTCGNRKSNHSCNKKNIKKEVIEDIVVKDAKSLLTEEFIEELATMAMRQNEKDINRDTLIPSLEAELKEIEKSINNLIKMVEKGAESDALTKRLCELEDQKKAITRRLVEEQSEVVILEKEHIIWWLSKFRDGDIEDPVFRRTLVGLLISSVTVWDDPDGGFKITIMCNLTKRPTMSYKLGDDKSSDIGRECPPTRAYPNYFVQDASYFGLTFIHN